ncbi:MAG: hypothetical protein RR726_15745, partial [Pseudomonas sp.]
MHPQRTIRATLKKSLAVAVVRGIASFGVAAPLLLAPAWAMAAPQQEFDIAPGSLAGALNQFGQAAQIL